MSAPTSFRLPYILSFLAALGIALAFISVMHHTADNNGLGMAESAYCNISATMNCNAVNVSPYSYLFGVPVGSYGLWFYLGVLIFAFLIRGSNFISRETAISVALVLGTVALVVSIAFFLISELLIKVLCPVCVGIYAVNVLILLAALISAGFKGIPGRIAAGVTALIRAPLNLFSPPSPETFRSSALITLYLILTAYGAITLPDVILVRMLLPTAMTKNEDDEAMAAIQEWHNTPVIAVPVDSSGSPLTSDYSKGDINAPIQIVEFSDFECPFCRQLYGELENLMAQHPGKIRLVFRNFPLDNSCNPEIPKDFHKNACEAAIFSRCAGEQGKFWEAIDYLFTLEAFDTHGSKETVSAAIARGTDALGLDGQAMKECIASDRPKSKILLDIADASKAGLQGTPFVIVNGKQVKVPKPKVLSAIFDLILSGK